MKRLARPRRSLWLGLVLGLVVAVLAAAAAVALAGLQPADLTFTPKSESQMTNIDVARAWAKNYYGAPTATSGPGGTWAAPLNQNSNYANEARSVADKGDNWLAARSKVPNRAIVLDVDDTTLTTWNYELYSNWDFNPTTNAQFVGLTGSELQIEHAEALAGVPYISASRGKTAYVRHSSLVLPYSPDGRAHVVYTQGFKPNDYAHDLPLLLDY